MQNTMREGGVGLGRGRQLVQVHHRGPRQLRLGQHGAGVQDRPELSGELLVGHVGRVRHQGRSAPHRQNELVEASVGGGEGEVAQLCGLAQVFGGGPAFVGRQLAGTRRRDGAVRVEYLRGAGAGVGW